MDILDAETSPFSFEQLVSLVDYAMKMSTIYRPHAENCFYLTTWIWNAVAELSGADYPVEAMRPMGKVKILRWKHRLVAKGAVGRYLFEDQAVTPEHLEAHLEKWQEWSKRFNTIQSGSQVSYRSLFLSRVVQNTDQMLIELSRPSRERAGDTSS